MTRGRVLWLHVGDPRHGVHRFGAVLATAAPDRPPRLQLWVADVPTVPARVAAACRAHRPDSVIVQFTDRLWGADPDQAAARFAASVHAAGSVPVVVGLHDLPTVDDSRRGAAYRAVALAADSVIVCSEHERRRLGEFCTATPTVIPHPVERAVGVGSQARRRGDDVTVLGFVYPGKGQDDVIEAVRGTRSKPPVLLVGGAAPGHEDMATNLVTAADRSGVRLRVTGWVPGPVLTARARRAAVPVVPNRAPSASGSLARWLAVGRRPLACDSDYVREIDELMPGAVEIYPSGDPDALAARVERAMARPGSTVAPRVPDHVRPEAVATRWARWATQVDR